MNKEKTYININGKEIEVVTPIEYLLGDIEELTPQGQEILRQYYLGDIHKDNINED